MQARQMFERAIELDPRYVTAYVGLGRTHLNLFRYGWTEFPTRALEQTHDLAQKALNLEDSNASAHALLGLVYRNRMQYDLAIKELERAIELNPNNARSHAALGTVMNYISRPDDAIHKLETALRFDPNMFPGYYMHLGLAYYLKGRYDDSISTLNRGLGWYPDHVFIHIPLAAAYAQAGRLEEAERAAATVLRLHPFFEVDSYGDAFINPADRASIADGLRKAGLQ
jgi:adenylate cyclase